MASLTRDLGQENGREMSMRASAVESHLKKAVLEEVAASYLMKKGINGAALRRKETDRHGVNKTDQGTWA